jgi:hypothetical protein
MLNSGSSGVSGFSDFFDDNDKGQSERRKFHSASVETNQESVGRTYEEPERNDTVSQQSENVQDGHNYPSPSASVNIPKEVLIKSRVTMYGSVSYLGLFSWTQIEGPTVELSNDATLAPSFTAPDKPTTLVFVLTVTNPDGVSTSQTSSIKVVSDVVEVHQATWLKGQGKGKLKVVASSSAIVADSPLPPDELTMTARVWNKDLPAGLHGSISKPLELPMTYVRNLPGKPSVCHGELPCFSAAIDDGILDPKSKEKDPKFLQPTHIEVRSSLGGSTLAKGTDIKIR